jgi:hypothetical protein
MSENIITYDFGSKRGRTARIVNEPAEPTPPTLTRGEKLYGPSRSRESVRRDIDAHIKARKVYAQAVAWAIAAEEQGLPQAQIDQALNDTREFHLEMEQAARDLLTCLPTDLRALVDLLMYLEQNFSVLPEEIQRGKNSESLAFRLLRTVRLSLRSIARYGKSGADGYVG